MNRDEYNRLSKIILDACFTVHKEMGPGLLESVYELCLMKDSNDLLISSYFISATRVAAVKINSANPLRNKFINYGV